jgi:hypothetical protein
MRPHHAIVWSVPTAKYNDVRSAQAKRATRESRVKAKRGAEARRHLIGGGFFARAARETLTPSDSKRARANPLYLSPSAGSEANR